MKNQLESLYDICIVGGGAICSALLNSLCKNNCTKRKIAIIAPDREIGPGSVYKCDLTTNLINRTVAGMYIDSNDKHGFYKWLIKQPRKRYNLKDSDYDELHKAHVPREIFGHFLKESSIDAIQFLRLKNNCIDHFIDTAEDLNKTADEKYGISTKKGKYFVSKSVVIAIGSGQRNPYKEFNKNKSYSSVPYPVANVISSIPSDSVNIGIIGNQLSAIDVAIAVLLNKKNSHITMFSRTSTIPPISDRNDALEKIIGQDVLKLSNIDDSISLNKAAKLFASKIKKEVMPNFSLSSFLHNDNAEESHKISIEDQILYKTISSCSEGLWHKLDRNSKVVFFKYFKNRFFSKITPMASPNYKIIMRAKESGRLNFVNNISCIKAASFDDGFEITTKNAERYCVDFLINAGGAGIRPDEFPSIVSRMISNGILKSNEISGIEVDYKTNQIVGRENRIQKGLFALGNITSGVFLYTSSLPKNVEHVEKIVPIILSETARVEMNTESTNASDKKHIKKECL
ncbi:MULTISPECIES: FAD/NAD(P)-binding protein [unclassified Halomonas]|uniref:FAD/NAD(P)-binding protein n=1 Tax=unclassified Halomonas TaxID=2609666 RepID=UPI0009905D0D|nr:MULTISPECIES: FAD/NAD(P)-binding protein [unclassified Halomonas]AQU81289.1 hypothetical protein B2G49_00855 [Halomonas sp. 'Soap Lake \